MTKEYLISNLESTNWIKTKAYSGSMVYQKNTIDDDFMEVTVHSNCYEIEYFTQSGPGTYNSFLLCHKFFACEYDDKLIKPVEQVCFTVEESLLNDENKDTQ